MAGVILETISNKQLIIFTLALLGVQIMFFIIGGTLSPHPTSVMRHKAQACLDPTSGSDGSKWFVRGACREIQNVKDAPGIEPSQIVFTVRIPHQGLDMSRWHQFIVGVMSIEIDAEKVQRGEHPIITLHMRLGAKDKSDSSWKQLANSTVQRDHNCRKDENGYDCDDMPAFELGSCHYDHYLVNIRLPYKNVNKDFGQLDSVYIVEIHQNGGFTRMWFGLKTVLAPLLIAAVVWFKRRINRLPRRPFLFEKTIFWLGVTIALLDFPLEWFTLWFDMPYMLIISDIRQGIFYANLLSFWLIFAGEHVMDSTERNSLKVYRKEIVAVAIGALSLLIFDLCERGIQLNNPFHSIWSIEKGKKAAMAFLIFAAICACLYFLFFLLMMLKVFWHISGKRSEFSRMAANRRVAYEGAFYRFKFLLAFTIICAALTIAFFIATNVNEAHWKFGEKKTIEISSAFVAGIYGLWNIYVFAVLVLYAPSSPAMITTRTIELEDVADETTILSDTQRFITHPVNAETSLIYSIAGKGNIE